MKKILSTGLVVAAMMSLIGCGGGSSSDSETNTVTGQFVDTYVEGLNYTCDPSGTTGTTNSDGEYTCNEGDTVEFSIGSYVIGSATASSGIVTPEILYPNDEEAALNVAQLLQTLDDDDNASNGIVIPEGFDDLDDVNTTPDEEGFEDAVEEVLDEDLVNEEDAQEHLDETELTLLFAGKTFYVVVEESRVNTLVFNDDLTLLTDVEFSTMSVRVDGDKIYIGEDGEYHTIAEVKDDYLLMNDYTNADLDGQSRLYFEEAKAQAYLDSLNIPDPTVTELLVGNTLYQHCQDGNGDWIATLTFQENGDLVIVDDGNETETLSYRIVGDTIYVLEDGIEIAHTMTEVTATYIKFGDASDSIFYFTSEAAQAAPATDCGGEESLAFTTSNLDGKIIYAVFTEDNEITYTQVDFTTTQMLVHEYNSGGTLLSSWERNYTVLPDGSIDVGVEDNFKRLEIQSDRWIVLCTCDDDGDGIKETSETHEWLTVKPVGFPEVLSSLEALLSGGTFYNNKGGEGDYIKSLVFNEDATSMTATVLYGPEAGTWTSNTISIEGNKVIFNGSDGFLTFIETTNEYLLFAENVRFYFDQAIAEAYWPAPSGGDYIMITEAMLSGKTFYNRDSDGEGENAGYGFGAMTFTATEGTRHEIWYNADGTVRSNDTFSFPIALVDGNIRADVTQFDEGYIWFTLTSQDESVWYLNKEQDPEMDGADGSETQQEEWFLSRPADFPESL